MSIEQLTENLDFIIDYHIKATGPAAPDPIQEAQARVFHWSTRSLMVT